MKALRSSGLIAMMVLLTVLLAACGDTMSQGTPANSTNQGMNNQKAMNNKTDNGMMNATPTATSNMNDNNNMNNNGNMMDGITITPSTGGNMDAFIHTGVATIDGNHVNVLMTNKGFALYYYRADPMLKATCTGQCAHDWPPVLAPQGMMALSSSMPLPRQLSVHQTANGAQIFYDGHALYTYAADMQAGIATGRGQDQQWYLVGFTL